MEAGFFECRSLAHGSCHRLDSSSVLTLARSPTKAFLPSVELAGAVWVMKCVRA